MPPIRPHRPRVFVDADVLFAGAASPGEQGASLVILRLAEITLLEAVTSEQVIAEAERTLAGKVPQALPAFRLLVSRCLRVAPNPTRPDLEPCTGLAQAQDLPNLVAAVREGGPWLVTFNLRHYQPGHPQLTVLRPGEFVLRVRELLTGLSLAEGD